MTDIFLYASQQSSDLVDIIVWGMLLIAVAAMVFLIVWQRKAGKQLANELVQLEGIKEDDVELEFILKAMKIATWHMDVKTRQIAYDNDFRERTSEWMFDASVSSGDMNESVVLLHEDDAPRVAASLLALCDGTAEEYHEIYRVRIPHTDNVYWEESYATVSKRDIDGNPTMVVGTSKRIDDQKKMEEALIDARNRAEESDRLKTAFLANMSHEIRTPLNAIIGFTGILPDVEDAAERQELLNLIHENTQKLLRIIDDVVNISKIEAGKEEMVMTQFDLSMVLGQLTDEYQSKLHNGVVMTNQFAASPQIVTTDLSRLTEVMKHLISNATKFTSLGTIVVGFDAPRDGRIRIWVRDTGKGVAKEHLEQIFERFFKVDEFIPGAGLGLSICRTMAYSMGGSVTCESQLGEGSTFTFEIPVEA